MHTDTKSKRNQQVSADLKPLETLASAPDEAGAVQNLDGDGANIEAETSTIPESSPEEIGGPQGLEPTRYGDWEKRGRCIDF